LLERFVELDEDHRIVLVLRYIDAMPVDQIATTISRTTTATYSLLARARDELRAKVTGPVVGGMS
jgi:DNA-directed RNA polymerase specialized sigma24 family protein